MESSNKSQTHVRRRICYGADFAMSYYSGKGTEWVGVLSHNVSQNVKSRTVTVYLPKTTPEEQRVITGRVTHGL